MMSARLRRAVVPVAALAVFAGVAPAAHAAAPTLHASYRVKGTTTIAMLGAKVAVGPSKLTANVAGSGRFTGSMPLPNARMTATLSPLTELAKVTATVHFIPVGKVTGQLQTVKSRVVVSARAAYIIRVSDIKVGGVALLGDVGDHCQTVKPVVITVKTPAKKSFDLTKGGVVTGTYPIGEFAGCGLLADPSLNFVVSGPGNTVSMTLSNGKVSS